MKKTTNTSFIFQTGHGKGLAKAEIEALLGSNVTDEVEDGFVVEAEVKEPIQLLNRMGGIVRITEVLQRGSANLPLNFVEWVSKALEDAWKGMEGKKRFGLSMHPKSDKILKKTLNEAKRTVQNVGNVRFVNKDFQNLSSVQAWHEGLLADRALELHLFKSEGFWYLTKTLAIQDFEAYSKRDYDRPSRSAKNGMFPPKLAQMLINLATKNTPLHIFDPFCGSGTVMQEAFLMGLTSSGSDISKDMVTDSQMNLDWLKREFHTDGALPKVFHADATQLTAENLPNEPFAIVSETWLGPALNRPLTPIERPKVQREIEALYEAFFKNLSSVLKTPSTVVFTAPYHREGNNRHFLPHLPEILKKYGKIIPLSDHERPTLFFERKEQLVSREIWKVQVGK